MPSITFFFLNSYQNQLLGIQKSWNNLNIIPSKLSFKNIFLSDKMLQVNQTLI